ncbi:hypothetical protein C1141_01575 [Vibrio agarivorans]|uniref:Uncharacterized protein n=1 Tax=Vibrio sagamiensis NBRC 104589 TaxID=1219064 RepID=A0A511Q9J0_9VIBR|nr:hypothetical protein C1141_01575 [Vibrio agarivorans]GEM73963.1 hypothetical protein VSA01S_00750 [Vibrio sagamiensis NBRC 104589]
MFLPGVMGLFYNHLLNILKTMVAKLRAFKHTMVWFIEFKVISFISLFKLTKTTFLNVLLNQTLGKIFIQKLL